VLHGLGMPALLADRRCPSCGHALHTQCGYMNPKLDSPRDSHTCLRCFKRHGCSLLGSKDLHYHPPKTPLSKKKEPPKAIATKKKAPPKAIATKKKAPPKPIATSNQAPPKSIATKKKAPPKSIATSDQNPSQNTQGTKPVATAPDVEPGPAPNL
jgi:hypothetical protein